MNRTGPLSTVYGYNALYSHTRESRKYQNETLSLVMDNTLNCRFLKIINSTGRVDYF